MKLRYQDFPRIRSNRRGNIEKEANIEITIDERELVTVKLNDVGLVLLIFYEGSNLKLKSILCKALNLYYFDCEITLESVPGTNQYLALTVSCTRKQLESVIGFEPTTDRFRVIIAKRTHNIKVVNILV